VTPEGASRDEQGLGGAPDERDETSPDGERWGCLIVDRASRFIVAHATGRIGEEWVAAAVRLAASRTGQRPLSWCSDGWRGYAAVLTQQDRRPVRSGRRGRPPLVVPPTLQLTHTVKHRDAHGRLLGIAVCAALGPLVAAPGTVHVERLHGTLRDRLNALTRKTHAFARPRSPGTPSSASRPSSTIGCARIPPSLPPVSRLAATMTALPQRWHST